MNLFTYLRPTSLAEAVAASSGGDATFIAGGTNLLDLMKAGVSHPGRLIDITRLAGLSDIETLPDGAIRIGALVKNAEMARHPAVVAAAPAVSEALLSGASAQLRNAASVGGNLMQKTRCAYFYDPASACNRRAPGAGCDALEGAERGHAVLGWSPACVATHPSDLCVALVALDAVVEIEGPQGAREIALDALHKLPGETPQEETALAAGELIKAVRIPAEAARFRANSRYLKLRERTSFAFALVSAAAALTLEDGTITEARLALGAVAAKPWRAHAAEALLVGAPAELETFRRAAEAALEGARSPRVSGEASGDAGGAPLVSGGAPGGKVELAVRVAARALALAAAGTPDRAEALPGSVFAPHPLPLNGATAHG